MLNKLKKFMVIAAATVMLSVGFATISPNAASAHWADKQMNWAFNKRIITADLRDSYATRQDAWLMITRATQPLFLMGGYEEARQSVIKRRISDGTRGTNWVTRNEMAAMIFNYTAKDRDGWTPQGGFEEAIKWGRIYGYYDGTRGNDAATRAEVVTMLYNAFR
ncbi:protein phosphatase 2C [Bacillus thuringiensis]|uniref:protein phosphatase 2C n=1 Tax=Bacillus thuringiensis TaxID=1428 RepID=UPI0022257519|nr:protein phosphatase 2C [Bacillus thuringiensis]UYX50584.1 protein phosphatase 2C [Bacillus thuringiensis]